MQTVLSGAKGIKYNISSSGVNYGDILFTLRYNTDAVSMQSLHNITQNEKLATDSKMKGMESRFTPV